MSQGLKRCICLLAEIVKAQLMQGSKGTSSHVSLLAHPLSENKS